MKRISAILLSLAMLLTLSACADKKSASDTSAGIGDNSIYSALPHIELIGGDSAGVGAAAQLCGELIAERLAETTDGRFVLNYHPNGRLGSDADLQQQMLDGDIDLVICQTAPTVSFVPEAAIFDLPCLFAPYSAETIDKSLNSGVFSDTMRARYAEHGIELLGFLQGATYRLTSSNRALRSLEDFKGLSIRTMENANHMAFWKSWGANPTPYAWSEVYLALDTGVFEAEENAADTIIGASLYEVQDYLCLTNHILYCNQIMMNAKTYELLPQEYKTALNEAVDYARWEIGTRLPEINEENIRLCCDKGMELISYDEDFYVQLKELASPSYKAISADVGEELVELLQAELEKG